MLSEVGNRIRGAVNREFGPGSHWISAEISDLTVRKGHCYLHLVEKRPGAAAPMCEMKAMIWSDRYARISEEFRKGTGTDLARDTVILFRAVVRFDVKWGLSLMIESIEPAYTLGLIQQEKERTIAKLKNEGVFDRNRNLEFPVVPQNIALISSADSRGYEDFMRKLLRNIYNYRYNVELFPSRLQGDAAAEQITRRLIEIYESDRDFDIIVIVRGGGGSVDLNCFNDYRLSRAVARFPVPVITGIGHTANISVVDEVAYTHRITPTDAADFIVEKTNEFERLIDRLIRSVHGTANVLVHEEKERLRHHATQIRRSTAESLALQSSAFGHFLKRLYPATGNRIRNAQNVLADLRRSFSMITRSRTRSEMNRLESEIRRVPRLISGIARSNAAMLKQHRRILQITTEKLLQQRAETLDRMEGQVKLSDPVHILKRGYSMTLHNGALLRNSTSVEKGDKLKTILYEGTIESEVSRSHRDDIQ